METDCILIDQQHCPPDLRGARPRARPTRHTADGSLIPCWGQFAWHRAMVDLTGICGAAFMTDDSAKGRDRTHPGLRCHIAVTADVPACFTGSENETVRRDRVGRLPGSLPGPRSRAESRHAELREIRKRSPARRRLESNGGYPQHGDVAV